MDDLARQLGLFHTAQVSIRVTDLSKIGEMMTRLRTAPPAELVGSAVTVRDLAEGSLETTGVPPTDGMLLLAEDGTRVIVRPSGTEPKLKAYLEVIEQCKRDASFDELTEMRERAAERMAALKVEVRKVIGA